MNVLELLNHELNSKNWTTEEKAYHIYIRSCQLFSYDPRFKFCGLVSNGKEIERKIKDKKIDLENVQDNRVICLSHSKEVLSPLLKELLDIDCLERGNNHSWLIFNDGFREVEADATLLSDIVRVKMGLTTYGYNPVYREINYNDHLKQMSKRISYIKEDYSNYFLEERKKSLFEEFVADSYSSDVSKDSDDFIIYKLYLVKELFESFDQLPLFSDSEFCISYLLNKFLKDELKKIEMVSLFQNLEDENCEFINIYPIKLKDDMIYFMLESGNNVFNFYEITKSDAVNYTKTYDGTDKQLIYK